MKMPKWLKLQQLLICWASDFDDDTRESYLNDALPKQNKTYHPPPTPNNSKSTTTKNVGWAYHTQCNFQHLFW